MSLKAFHVLFITISVALTVYFAVWALNSYRASGGAAYIAIAALSLAVGAGLVVYELAFLKKTRQRGID